MLRAMQLLRPAARLAGALLLAAGFGKAPAAQQQEPPRVLRVVAPIEIGGLEPARSGAVFARMGVVETLVGADAEGKPVPALAERWSVDETGLVWRFRLRPGARFHDGAAVTAEAAAASLGRARAAATALARAPIAAIEADGAETVLVRLERPFAPLPAFLAHYGGAVLAPASYDEAGRVREVIGTGPYRVADLTLPMRMEVSRFEGWWGGEPAIARAVYLVAGQGEMRALMAESGQADLVFALQPVTVARLQRNPRLDVRLVPIPRTRLLKLNAASPMLDDPRERRALSLAIDRRGIAGAILRNPPWRPTSSCRPRSRSGTCPGCRRRRATSPARGSCWPRLAGGPAPTACYGTRRDDASVCCSAPSAHGRSCRRSPPPCRRSSARPGWSWRCPWAIPPTSRSPTATARWNWG